VGVRLATLVSTAVLAHLLSPRDFGLVAIALVFTTLLDAVRDLGLNQALVVARQEELHDQASTVFVFSILAGVALAAMLAGASPLAATFFHQPGLLALLAVLGVNLPLRSVGLTHYAIAQRDLTFRSRTLAELGEVIVRGGVGLGLALSGFGAWSLVAGYLAGTAAWTAGLWITVPWRPAKHFRSDDLRRLMHFGGALTVIGIISTAMSYADNLFVGRVLGPSALGRYSLGYRLPELLIIDVTVAASLVMFPAFSRLDTAALRRAVISVSQYSLLLSVPVAVALVILADPVVLALFGRRWGQAASIIRIISVAFVGVPVGVAVGSAFRATKRVGVMLKLAVPQGILLVVAVAVFVPFGIKAVAWCQAAVRELFVAISIAVSMRVLGIRARELGRAARPAVLASAGMALVMLPLEEAISSPWYAIVVCCAAGGTVYLALAWLLAGDAIPTAWRLISGARTAQIGGTGL
jgi:PST family polysaccharide transporter